MLMLHLMFFFFYVFHVTMMVFSICVNDAYVLAVSDRLRIIMWLITTAICGCQCTTLL